MASEEIVILGGGAAGCATAYYLAKEGFGSTVIEMEAIGSHASGFAFGGLTYHSGAGIPGPVFPLAREAYRLHEVLFEDLLRITNVDTFYRKGPGMALAFDEEDLKELEERLAWQAAAGVKAEMVTGEEARRIEPRINPEVIGASRMEEGAAVEAYRFVLALIQAAERMGAKQRHGKVVGIKRDGNRPSAVVLDSGEVPCDTIVVAMGPWSGQASEWLDFPVPVTPLKGQILRLQMQGEPLACSLGYRHSYAGSKPDGLTWCGTTEEEEGFDESITPYGTEKVMADALKMVPALEEAELALQTACLRPLSADHLPIIGPVPGWDGVYLCTGAGRKGILLSTIMGMVITELITRGETPWEISELLPDRFAAVAS